LPLVYKIILKIFISFFIIHTAFAEEYLPIDEETYFFLQKLEGEGIIQSGLLTTKPLSRKEIARLIKEAEENSKNKSLYIKIIVKKLKENFNEEFKTVDFIKPINSIYIKYFSQDTNLQLLNYNNDGDNLEKGSNLRIGFETRAKLHKISYYLNPELRTSDNKDNLIIKRGYLVLGFDNIDIRVGRDSQWWGPGIHGSLLLSNNAPPFKMINVTNPIPFLLPSFLKYFGPFKFNFFVTKLEKDRDVPEPYLWGLRINFKPTPYTEISLERTALLGGKGRSESLKTWLYSFTGKGENVPGVEAGDQRAGGDIKITIPLKIQPFQVYFEAAGEDEAGGFPCKWAYLYGIYLPRIKNIEELGLRLEYAKTSPAWYVHHIYTSGYTYKGWNIGHHMGRDSNNLYLELTYLSPNLNRFSIFYDREKSNITNSKKTEMGLSFNTRIKKFDINLKYTKAWFEEFPIKNGELLNFGIKYNF